MILFFRLLGLFWSSFVVIVLVIRTELLWLLHCISLNIWFIEVVVFVFGRRVCRYTEISGSNSEVSCRESLMAFTIVAISRIKVIILTLKLKLLFIRII